MRGGRCAVPSRWPSAFVQRSPTRNPIFQSIWQGTCIPGAGGISVYASLRTIPAEMVPKRLRPILPFARGSNNLKVWALGEGTFEAGTVAAGLWLRIDPENPLHGFIEPDAIMSITAYESALVATRA